MKHNLCIDAGNTRLKAALVNPADGAVLKHFAQDDAASGDLSALQSFIAGQAVRAAIISAVTGDRDALAAVLSEAGIQQRIVLDSRLALPIANAYATPDTVGADRIALACGAWAKHRGEDVLVISAGTCITYNLITKTGTFRGGAISPGVAMRLRAMHHFTDALPEISAEGDTRLLGYDTESSLRSGGVLGAVAEIDGFAAQFSRQYADLKIILTGGDALLLQSHLSTPLAHEPHLIFSGLNAILNYHMPYVAG